MASCTSGDGGSWWIERADSASGSGSIATVSAPGGCINAGQATTAAKCRSGACVHLHDCPDSGGGAADFFHYDTASATLVQETCAPKRLCVVSAPDGSVALGACDSPAAKWNRTVHA